MGRETGEGTSAVEGDPTTPDPAAAPEGQNNGAEPGDSGVVATTTTTTTTGTQSTTTIGGEGSPPVTISGSTVNTSGDPEPEPTQEPDPSSSAPTPTATVEPSSTPAARSELAPTTAPTNTAPVSPFSAPAAQQDTAVLRAQAPAPAAGQSTQTAKTVVPPTRSAGFTGVRLMTLTASEERQLPEQFSAGANTLKAPAPPPPPATPTETLPAIPGRLISVALDLVTAALQPAGPGAPLENALLWGVLAWTRREFERR